LKKSEKIFLNFLNWFSGQGMIRSRRRFWHQSAAAGGSGVRPSLKQAAEGLHQHMGERGDEITARRSRNQQG